jgi:hypothetical protein
MAAVLIALKLLDGGPPLGLQRRFGLVQPDRPRIVLRIVLAVAVGWLPIMLIGGLSDCTGGPFESCAPWFDFSIHARSLVAVPLLIAAELACVPQLGAIAYHFHAAGLVQPTDEGRYLAAVLSTLRLRDSIIAEVVVIACAYALASLAFSIPFDRLPVWHRSEHGDAFGHSPAGWWHTLVSLPILLALLLGWLWRLLLWFRFLGLMTRLDLCLIPSHPDRSAGLKIVGYAVRAYAPLGFVLGVIVAGSIANQVVYAGAPILAFKYFVMGLVIVTVGLFAGPSLVFMSTLLKTWRRGVFDYGALADRMGRQFEQKWLRDIDEGRYTLDAPDFSAMTDLQQMVANVYQMRLMPLDVGSVIGLIIATLLPLVPVLLLAAPFDEIFLVLTGLLF